MHCDILTCLRAIQRVRGKSVHDPDFWLKCPLEKSALAACHCFYAGALIYYFLVIVIRFNRASGIIMSNIGIPGNGGMTANH